MLKAIIFDIDGVLIDSLKANSIFYEGIFKHFGIKYSRKEYFGHAHHTMWDFIKLKSPDKSEEKVKEIWDFGRKFPKPYEHFKIPKNVLPVLKILSKDYKLVVVTARVITGVTPVFKKYGYSKYLKMIVSFGDYKNPKPHPEPLLVALKKFKIKPSEAAYVGDTESDMLCAKAAGVTSILYKNRHSNVKKIKPDFTVKSFDQLLKLLHARKD